ncbi:MAG: hypothetical protein LBV18_01505 [Alistipes sp.]|jgi:hypothetical protein|nr:hypothetical protein [Alistipes sp.]
MRNSIYNSMKFGAVAVMAALLLGSCIRDNLDSLRGDDEFRPGEAATLRFDPAFGEHKTRTGYETYGPAGETFPRGSAQDSLIVNFRVLIYDGTTGDLVKYDGEAWNYLFNPGETAPYTVRVATGIYDFVFIANTDKAAIFGTPGTAPAAIDTFGELAAIDFTVADDIKGGKGATLEHAIPMVQIFRGVKVLGSNRVSLDGGATTQTSPWPVSMERAAIRISMHLNLSGPEYAAWVDHHGDASPPAIIIDGLRDRTHFMPGTVNVGGTSIALPMGTKSIPVYPAAQTDDPAFQALFPDGEYGQVRLYKGGVEAPATTEPDSAAVFVERLIFPELLFAPTSNGDLALRMSMRFDDGAGGTEEKSALLHAPNVAGSMGYTLPRNSWLWVDGSVESEMEITTRVLPWSDGDLEGVDMSNYRFTIDRDIVVFPNEGGTETVNIFTDHPTGWRLDASSLPSWIDSFEPRDGEKDKESAVTLTASAGGAALQKAVVVVRAGNLHKNITVMRLPQGGDITADPAPANVRMYVGAFWRADQYGERLIRISRPTAAPVDVIDGEWMATVLEGREWIVLDDVMPKDRNVGWRTDVVPDQAAVADGGDNGFDLAHRVNSSERTVRGVVGVDDPQIYFRVGLEGTIDPEEHRYGVVLLVYTHGGATRFHKIYVRQGEEADYLMRPTDVANGITPVEGDNRPLARKFSPYNLTAREFGEMTAEAEALHVDVGYRGGVFTRYPSQAGAMFRWAHPEGVFAYNPVASEPRTEGSLADSWSALKESHEGCPAGYMRPSDGNTNGVQDVVNNNNSEMFQSLFRNLPSDQISSVENSVWGYYADGYFDRREMVSSPPPTADSGSDLGAVAASDYSVAYGGRLFYNPETNGSLFFPAAGHFNDAVGPGNAGSHGYYWSSSLKTLHYGWYLDFKNNNSFRNFYGRSLYGGASVRCVVEPPQKMLNLAPPGVIGYFVTGPDVGKLTLAGDYRFKNTPVADKNGTDETTLFGKISNYEVHVAYFKFGSLVAVSSKQTVVNGLSVFDPAKDIKQVPAEVTTGITSYTNNYQPQFANVLPSVPAYDQDYAAVKNISAAAYNNPTNWAKGKGDPCDYYFGRDGATYPEFGKGWKLPVGSHANGGWNGGSFGTSPTSTPTGIQWSATGGAAWNTLTNTTVKPNVIIDGAVAGDGSGQPDWSMYLSASGYRRSNDGVISVQGDVAEYWSSTAFGNANGYSMSLYRERLGPVWPDGSSQGARAATGSAVRCVRPSP